MNPKGTIATLIALLMLLAVFIPTGSAVQNGGQMDEKTVLEKIQNLPGVDKNSIQIEPRYSFPITSVESQSAISEGDKYRWNWKPRLIHFSFPIKNEDGPLPIIVDVWINLRSYNYGETKIDYILPGSGLNVDANFNTNPDRTLIENRLVEEGYFMVVGITPPEASYDPESSDYSEEALKNYGSPSHVKDVRKVIELFQSVGFDYDYTIEGHSAGAFNAALVAVEIGSSDPHFKGLDIHDMVLQYKPGTAQAEYARISHGAVSDLYNSGVYEYSSFEDYKQMAALIRAYPGVYIDSGVPREFFAPDFSGNFSVEGLFYFASIHTGWMPGPVTGATGLPDSWPFGNGGYLTGDYQFMPDPADDVYSFSLTRVETMFEALDKIEYGAYPTAFERDIMAVWAGINPVDWSRISVPVKWENAEYGFGDVSEIDQAYEILSQKTGFLYSVRKGVGHADIMFADDAFK